MDHFSTSEITKIDIGILDAKSKCRFTNYKSRNPGGGTRGEIRELSRQSRTRLLYKARNIGNLTHLVTFTYPHEDYAENATGGNFMQDGLTVKNHLRKLRQALVYRGFYGFWFLEFQKRGAPHFHFFCCGDMTADQVLKLKKTWHKMVGSTCQHHLDRGVDYQELRKKHSAGAYAAKYSSKDEQKTVPDRYQNVGRFWGLFGNIPKNEHQVITSVRELYQMARIARRYAKAQSRNKYKIKVTRGLSGQNLYNCGPVLRAYLEYHYTIPENLSRIEVLAPGLRNSASEIP